MAARKNSLQAVLERKAKSAAPEPEARQPEAPASHKVEAPIEVASKPEKVAKFQRPSREGRKLVAGHFDPKVAKQLKLLAAEEETTVQALLEEALDLLFVKKGKGAITSA